VGTAPAAGADAVTFAVRLPAVAGSFYPADPDDLARTVDDLLAAASGAHTPRPAGLIVPHAGYQFSGPVAATGYARLLPWRASYRKVVLLGPSHFVAVSSPTLPAADVLRTPLGDVSVNATELAVTRQDRPHGPGVAAERVADCLEAVAADDVLAVVSSDLSHYHDHATAQRLDRRTADAVVARDGAAIGDRDACGAMAIRGALAWASRHDLSVSLLDLRTSADTAGDPDRVVGYGTFAFERG
jgi:hypothetical protein